MGNCNILINTWVGDVLMGWWQEHSPKLDNGEGFPNRTFNLHTKGQVRVLARLALGWGWVGNKVSSRWETM